MRTIKLLILGLISVTMFSCEKTDPIDPTKDYAAVLKNIGNDVILNTYADLDEKTKLLVTALSTLESNPTDINLQKAQQAWRDSRSPWEQSEGFLFGPVDQQGIDPAMDSWPVNEPDLDAVLASNVTLTKQYIDGLDGTLKGFHTIEYLIFGSNGNKVVSQFTAREFAYLRACAESLAGATQQLYFAWKPEENNFIKNILTAGQSSNQVYPSQKAALQEILNGLITIADEVANGKINDPLSQQNVTLEESRFSSNSKKDFSDNIRSIKNAYIGTYKNTIGIGLTEIIKAKDQALDAKVKSQIDEAILAIENIKGTFTTAIFDDKSGVINAQTKVRDLQQTLESSVLNIITNL